MRWPPFRDQGRGWPSVQFVLHTWASVYDTPTVMEADTNVNGRLYVGYPGNGFVYFSENSSIEAAHLVIDNNTIELLPNPNESYFRIEGIMNNFTFELLDGNENIIENFGSPSGTLIIVCSS